MKDAKKLDKQVSDAIDKVLKPLVIKEAYVTAPKKFNLTTERLSEKAKRARIEHFESTVEAMNNISAQLDGVDLSVKQNNINSNFRNLKLAESFTINDSFLQAEFLENISDLHSVINMDTLSYMRLSRDFGDFETWQKNFTACALSSRNGYVVTAYSLYLKRYINFVVDDASVGVPFSAIPVIVLDVGKGVYARDYLNDVGSYVSNMMLEFNWKVIEERIKKAERIARVWEQK